MDVLRAYLIEPHTGLYAYGSGKIVPTVSQNRNNQFQIIDVHSKLWKSAAVLPVAIDGFRTDCRLSVAGQGAAAHPHERPQAVQFATVHADVQCATADGQSVHRDICKFS